MNHEYEYIEELPRMSMDMIQEMNTRLFFQSGSRKKESEVRPWQYVLMEYHRMGITPPANIPYLESMEDAEIWMCLDERVNKSLRMMESSLAG